MSGWPHATPRAVETQPTEAIVGPFLMKARVQHLHMIVRRQRDVRGFQIAVDDALLVRGLVEDVARGVYRADGR